MLEPLFNKVAGLQVCLQVCNFIKKRLQYGCFPVNIAKFLRPPFLKIICERLLLDSFLSDNRNIFTREVLSCSKSLILFDYLQIRNVSNDSPEAFDLTDKPYYHRQQEESKDSIVLLKSRDLQ